MEFILNTVDRKAYGVGGAKVRRLVVFSGKGVYRISLNFFLYKMMEGDLSRERIISNIARGT